VSAPKLVDGRDWLTVAALVQLLAACPPDALVMTEGCDCVGPAAGVRLASAEGRYGEPLASNIGAGAAVVIERVELDESGLEAGT
jgi:hypothetical protein